MTNKTAAARPQPYITVYEREKKGVLDGIKSYWGVRSDSYSRQNLDEMNDWRRDIWRDLILKYAPEGETLRILDVGTGPGFFAMNMALAGHQVTAVDVTEEMLEHAKENAQAYGAEVKFLPYDGKRLPLRDGSFDLIISRNVLWNMEEPEAAMEEWKRVLRPGGRFVYFDANWYLYLFDGEQKARHDRAHERYHRLYPKMVHDQLGGEKAKYMENLALKLPLSKIRRPDWDRDVLGRIGMKLLFLHPNVGEYVWEEWEKVHYEATPLFMVCAEKEV